jgi:hypothetical protein
MLLFKLLFKPLFKARRLVYIYIYIYIYNKMLCIYILLWSLVGVVALWRS